MKNRILIIKLGALGDVVRTTPLLRALRGEITWVTQKAAMPLLKGNRFIHKVVDIKNSAPLRKQRFDLVLNLEEDNAACELAAQTPKGQLVGPYPAPSGVQYTDSSAEWFDMSLISSLGKSKADLKKLHNRRTYQEILFSMVGLRFKGEEYVLPPVEKKARKRRTVVGVEMRSGDRWMGKRWAHAPAFLDLLDEKKIAHRQFHQSPTLLGFLKQIQNTDVVLTTDSLALHLALGLRKKIVALFTCTSPWEIHGYDRAIKIVSPLLRKHFYSTAKTLKSGEAIAPQTVYKALRQWLP